MSDYTDFSCAPQTVCSEGVCFTSECWPCGPSSSGFSSCCDYSTSSRSSSLDMSTGSLYASSASAADTFRSSYDTNKSVADHVREGSFIQSNRTPRLDQNDRVAGEPAKIVVTNDASVTPDFVVRQDGKVEVVGNPDAGNGTYRVQVEPGADQKVTDSLVGYLNDRIKAKEPNMQVSLLADPGLVSEEVSRRFTPPAPKPEDESSPDENPPPEDDSPSNPGGGGCPSSPDSPSDYPDEQPTDTPTDQPTDTTVPPVPQGPMDAILDAARLNNWDNNTLGALGAYEVDMTNWFSSWLDDEMLAELGKPPDFRKLAKVMAKHKGKMQAKMAERLGNMREQGDTQGADKIESMFSKLMDEKNTSFHENFGIFLNSQLPGGRNATGEEMNTFMDKDMQKAIASSRMADIAHEQKVRLKDLPPDQAAKMALAGALGHMPSPEELNKYNQFVQSVQTRYKPGTNKPIG